jgi:hypothetical protein
MFFAADPARAMPTELVMTAAEAARRLAALDTQWSDLQNAAIGRGLAPVVSVELADRVVAEWTQYHQWREQLGGYTAVWNYGDELNDWTRRANTVRAAISAEGKPVPAALGEWEQTGPTALLQGVGLAVGAVGLAWLLMSRGKK